MPAKTFVGKKLWINGGLAPQPAHNVTLVVHPDLSWRLLASYQSPPAFTGEVGVHFQSIEDRTFGGKATVVRPSPTEHADLVLAGVGPIVGVDPAEL